MHVQHYNWHWPKSFEIRMNEKCAKVFFIRYTQTAVASFGATKLSECRWKPGGFTRLTPEVLRWVKNVTGMKEKGIGDPGEM